MARTTTRERLTRESIVDGAIALADREGLDAVTIRRLAQDHSVTPMALYWHFKDKEQLLDGIAERLYSDLVLPEQDGRGWAEQLQDVLSAFVAVIRAHPAVADLAFSRVLGSEASLALAERVLTLLAEAGFDTAEAADVGRYLVCSIIGLVTGEPGPDPAQATEAAAAQTRSKIAALRAVSPDRFPHVIASAAALAVCVNEDAYYTRGIDLLVQGTVGIAPV